MNGSFLGCLLVTLGNWSTGLLIFEMLSLILTCAVFCFRFSLWGPSGTWNIVKPVYNFKVSVRKVRSNTIALVLCGWASVELLAARPFYRTPFKVRMDSLNWM